MPRRKSFGIRIPKKPLPSPKKIATRGLYEALWGAPQRNYGKRVGLDDNKSRSR